MQRSATLQFLRELKNNNNKEWFDKNRERYQVVKADFTRQMKDLIDKVQKIDPTIGEIEASKTLFRIHRDVRFSKDKRPYKTNFGGVIARGGTRKSPYACYYLHIEPENSFVGGGLYAPESKILRSVREDIYGQIDEFKRIVESPSFLKLFGKFWEQDKLTRPPQGFPTDFPDIDYLKYKHYTVLCKLSDEEVVSEHLDTLSEKVFRELKPLNDFLNRAIDFVLKKED